MWRSREEGEVKSPGIHTSGISPISSIIALSSLVSLSLRSMTAILLVVVVEVVVCVREIRVSSARQQPETRPCAFSAFFLEEK